MRPSGHRSFIFRGRLDGKDIGRLDVGEVGAITLAAAREIAIVLRDHIDLDALNRIIDELLEIRGNKDFRDSIESLVHALRMSSDR